MIRTVVFATTLGLIAGYYQEKNDNYACAIVYMAGNFVALLAVLSASLASIKKNENHTYQIHVFI